MNFNYICTECSRQFDIVPELMVCPDCSKDQRADEPVRGILEIALDIFFGVLVLASGSDRNPGYVRWMSLIGSVISFVMTLPLITRFDKTTAAMQFVEKSSWIERFHISYYLGVDGISMWFVVLTAFITSDHPVNGVECAAVMRRELVDAGGQRNASTHEKRMAAGWFTERYLKELLLVFFQKRKGQYSKIPCLC